MVRLSAWYNSDIGGLFLADEKQLLDHWLAQFSGIHLLRMGVDPYPDLMMKSPIVHKWVLAKSAISHPGAGCMVGHYEQIPLPNDSVHVVNLLHVLDHHHNPISCLKEADRVLAPEGHLVITGFNRHCWWRWVRLLPKFNNTLNERKIKHWARTLGYQAVVSRHFFYRPAIPSLRIQRSIRFLEPLWRILGPLGGLGYCIILKKRKQCLTPITPKWSKSKVMVNKGFPEPSTRSQL